MNTENSTIFKYNHFAIHKNLEGINQEESLIGPQSGGSSINWILGHTILTRDEILQELGLDKINQDLEKTYDRGTENVTNQTALPLEELKKRFDDTQEKIMKALTEKDLSTDEEKSKKLAFFGFHEAYHAGQLGTLRRIAGKDAAIK